jgi:sodium-dependent dicarboxylate transporter 2/3/5
MKPEATRGTRCYSSYAIWWVTECIPIYATAFIPIALFPLLEFLMQSWNGWELWRQLCFDARLAKAIDLSIHKRIVCTLFKREQVGENYTKFYDKQHFYLLIANVAVVPNVCPLH